MSRTFMVQLTMKISFVRIGPEIFKIKPGIRPRARNSGPDYPGPGLARTGGDPCVWDHSEFSFNERIKKKKSIKFSESLEIFFVFFKINISEHYYVLMIVNPKQYIIYLSKIGPSRMKYFQSEKVF